jgi:hypothetical protein
LTESVYITLGFLALNLDHYSFPNGHQMTTYVPLATGNLYPVAVANLLEKISSICEAEKWNGVGHHPDVASAAVKVGLTPFPVFVGNGEDLVVEALCVGRLVRRVRMICYRMSKVESLLGI